VGAVVVVVAAGLAGVVAGLVGVVVPGRVATAGVVTAAVGVKNTLAEIEAPTAPSAMTVPAGRVGGAHAEPPSVDFIGHSVNDVTSSARGNFSSSWKYDSRFA
jgi:hypothetical protein